MKKGLTPATVAIMSVLILIAITFVALLWLVLLR
jgi:hypothetical protein